MFPPINTRCKREGRFVVAVSSVSTDGVSPPGERLASRLTGLGFFFTPNARASRLSGMTKRRLLKISLGLLVVVGLFLAFVQRDRGPMVDGRPLEDWVQDLLVTAEPAKREAAQAAVAGLGTNAVPWLRRTLRYTDPVWKRPLISVVDSVPLLGREDIHRWANTYELSEIRAGGVAGLAALGQAATPAIPDLVTALGDPEHLVYNNALAALQSMGSQPLSEITNRLGQAEGDSLARMYHLLRYMKHDAAPAAPALLEVIRTKPGSNEANAAAAALSSMGRRAVPSAVQLAVDDSYPIRVVGFDALSRLLPVEHLLWAELKATVQLGNDREKEILAAVEDVWGNPEEPYPTLSAAVLRGTPRSCEAAIFLMSEVARPGNAYARKLQKLRDRPLKSGREKLDAALKKLEAMSSASAQPVGVKKTSE